MKKVLTDTRITLLALAAALLGFALLGLASNALAFTPLAVFPLFVAMALVAVRLKFPFGILLLVLTPVLVFVLKGYAADPTDTRFFLLLVLTFDLVFFFISVKACKTFLRNEFALPLAAYVLGKVLTALVLLALVVPLLPLMSYRTVVRNYLWGSPLFSLASFACFGAATVLVLRKLWKGNEKHA